MAIELELNTPAADALQNAVQSKLVELEWATGQEDAALAEYIMLSVASGKAQDEITAELANDFLSLDPSDANVVGFVSWLMPQAEQASNGGVSAAPQGQETIAEFTDGTNQDADMDDATSSVQDGGMYAKSSPTVLETHLANNIIRPTGPKSMRNGGKTRGNSMLTHMNKAMDRRTTDSPLHKIRGGAGVGKGARGAAPRGPRGNANGHGMNMNAQQLQQLGNMAQPMSNPMMNMGGQNMNMDPAQMMAMMQMFMGQQPQMAGNFGGQMNGGKSLFDRVSGRGRGRGRGGRGGSYSDRGQSASQQGDGASDAMDLTSEVDGASANGNNLDPANTLCRFNQRCTKPDCAFAHASPAAPPYANIDMGVECSFGIKCKNHKCVGKHPSPASAQKEVCRFYPNCTNPVCPYDHPKGAAPCRNGADCKVEGCTFFHSQTPCKFRPCTNPSCPYKHEEGQKADTNVSKGGNKIWVNPEIEGGEKAHVSERKFVDNTATTEELILPGKAEEAQQQQAPAEEMIA